MDTTAFRSTVVALFALAVSSCDRAGTTVETPAGGVETARHEFHDELERGPRTADELRQETPGAATVAHDDPRWVRRRGRTLLAGKPFTGLREEQAPDGRLLTLATYRNGLAEGWSLAWFESGQLRERRFWKAGRKHGTHLGWWENGEPRLELRLVDGEFDGVCREWHISGQLATARRYRSGEESGAQRSWSAKGELVANYVVRDGRRFGTIGSRPCFTVEDGSQAPKITTQEARDRTP